MKYFKLEISDYYFSTNPSVLDDMDSDAYHLGLLKYWRGFDQIEGQNLELFHKTGFEFWNHEPNELLLNAPELYYRMRVQPKDIMTLRGYNSGFTLSKKMKSLFSKEELKWYYMYNTNIWYRGKKQDLYYLFASMISLRHFIDFQRSEFYQVKLVGPSGVEELSRETIIIKGMDDFILKSSPPYTSGAKYYFEIKPKNIVLIPTIRYCPIVMTHRYFITQVVNEDMLERMTKNQITGIEKVTELDWLHGDW
jgi:hypothetical protein